MQKYGAEFIGTFWLVLGGCGSAVLAAAFPRVGIGLLGVALAFGLTVPTMAYAIGRSPVVISIQPFPSGSGRAVVFRRSNSCHITSRRSWVQWHQRCA